jgi:hypothetical protein
MSRYAVGFGLDQGPFGPVGVVERVGEDVDRVEADLLRHPDAERRVLAGLRPGRVDQAESH